MKKTLKWIGIIFVVFIAITIIAAIFETDEQAAARKLKSEQDKIASAQVDADKIQVKADIQPVKEKVITEKAEKVEAAAFTDTQRQAITDYFLSDEEPTVLDATWTDDKIFKIGVKDDGSRRDSLATYACDRINFDLGGKEQGVWVQIIDYNKLMKTKEWVKLGEAHC